MTLYVLVIAAVLEVVPTNNKNMPLKLITLTPKNEKIFFEYINEWRTAGEEIYPASTDPESDDYKTWLTKTENIKHPETCPKHLVTADTYFLADDSGKLLGAINIRHQLNDYLFKFGGNIGYGIRPSERHKDYAKIMLNLALQKCKELGMDKVLITCDKDNPASVKTIIANGGILENEFKNEQEIIQRYWIIL